MTPPTTDSTIANSPEYRPLAIWTRMPWRMSARPVIASRLMTATRAAAAAARASAGEGFEPPAVAVLGFGYVTFLRRTG